MKKFTTLKEDLLKESEQTQDVFNHTFAEAQFKLDIVKSRLDIFKKKYQGDLRNWGYVGSMGHVIELLDEMLEFLGEDIKNDTDIPKQLIPSDPESEIQ
jgi:hypothetical protein